MKTKLIFLLGVSILAAACQKRKYPEEKTQLEAEDIYVEGSVDGEPLTLKIGTDGYYCYSSYKQRADSVYFFEGELKKFNCNPCPRSLMVELSDYRRRPFGGSVSVDSALMPGNRMILPDVAKTSSFRFVSNYNKAATWVRWATSNGVVSQDSIMSCEFSKAGVQTVSLTVRTKENCESMVVNKLFIGGSSDFFACSINANPQTARYFDFWAGIIGGKPPYSYSWSFGDGGTSSNLFTTHMYNWDGSYPVNLRVEDAEHHVCESSYVLVTGNDKSSCSSNMILSRTGGRDVSLNGVKIQWTDATNTVLRSDSVVQPAESYFEITHSQPYAANEKGEAGQLLTLRFNVLLANGTRRIWLKSENAAIAVTYK